jgi:hypothetical protein
MKKWSRITTITFQSNGIAMHYFSANQSGKPINQFLVVVVWGW